MYSINHLDSIYRNSKSNLHVTKLIEWGKFRLFDHGDHLVTSLIDGPVSKVDTKSKGCSMTTFPFCWWYKSIRQLEYFFETFCMINIILKYIIDTLYGGIYIELQQLCHAQLYFSWVFISMRGLNLGVWITLHCDWYLNLSKKNKITYWYISMHVQYEMNWTHIRRVC